MVNRIDSKTPEWKKGLTRSLLSLAVLTALGTNLGMAQAQEAYRRVEQGGFTTGWAGEQIALAHDLHFDLFAGGLAHARS